MLIKGFHPVRQCWGRFTSRLMLRRAGRSASVCWLLLWGHQCREHVLREHAVGLGAPVQTAVVLQAPQCVACLLLGTHM